MPHIHIARALLREGDSDSRSDKLMGKDATDIRESNAEGYDLSALPQGLARANRGENILALRLSIRRADRGSVAGANELFKVFRH